MWWSLVSLRFAQESNHKPLLGRASQFYQTRLWSLRFQEAFLTNHQWIHFHGLGTWGEQKPAYQRLSPARSSSREEPLRLRRASLYSRSFSSVWAWAISVHRLWSESIPQDQSVALPYDWRESYASRNPLRKSPICQTLERKFDCGRRLRDPKKTSDSQTLITSNLLKLAINI